MISIGLPVFNSEDFIHNALESLLSQTFSDFELIISDNASSDNTVKICEEYCKKDKRIKLFSHKKNNGFIWNFNFVLEQAKSEYFMWAGVDDVWEPKFLEKNIEFLQENVDYVGSIGQVRLYRSKTEKLSFDKQNSHKYNKYEHVHPIVGSYTKKVNFCLQYCRASVIYGVYRTNVLKKSIICKRFPTWDLAVILNILKNGHIHVIDDVILYRYIQDNPSPSKIKRLLSQNMTTLQILFFEMPFTYWCFKNIGKKVFLKNIFPFIKLNCSAEYTIILELARMIKRILSGQDKFWIFI